MARGLLLSARAGRSNTDAGFSSRALTVLGGRKDGTYFVPTRLSVAAAQLSEQCARRVDRHASRQAQQPALLGRHAPVGSEVGREPGSTTPPRTKVLVPGCALSVLKEATNSSYTCAASSSKRCVRKPIQPRRRVSAHVMHAERRRRTGASPSSWPPPPPCAAAWHRQHTVRLSAPTRVATVLLTAPSGDAPGTGSSLSV